MAGARGFSWTRFIPARLAGVIGDVRSGIVQVHQWCS
jgi:hypothetical protein